MLVITSDEVIEREDSLGGINHENVQCPAVAIKSVQSFESCKKCRTKVISLPGKQITKCSDCGLVELASKPTNRMFANSLFDNSGKEISLALFDDKLQQLHELFCLQTFEKGFEECDKDDIMFMLLTVSATVVFNKDNNSVVAIKQV